MCVCFPHLAECAVTDTASELLRLSDLISHPFLLIQFLSEGLQFGQSQLQGQPVYMTSGGVLQHVLKKRGSERDQMQVLLGEKSHVFVTLHDSDFFSYSI